jgi:LacI family transcriptional regulator
MSKKHVSLKDLAWELGVSVSTVSRAMKNHPDISPEMTARIQKLAREWDYSPNPLAMGLLKQQTKMIGVVVPDLVTHFYSSIISGIEEVAKRHGYYILISSSNESFEKEAESVTNLMNTRVEGLIVCLSRETASFDHFEPLLRNEIPLVFFDRVCMTDKVSSVVADNMEAARSITCHFYENGCRRIAFIAGPEHLNITNERSKGYLCGLNDCRIEADPDLLEHCNLGTCEAIEVVERLLDLGQKPDAILCINDTVTFAAMKEIRRRGLRIPDDIALGGCFIDDFHATIVDPALTSVTHPTFEMGQEAARLFFRQVENPGAPPVQIVLKTRLVVRESSVRRD